MVTGWNKSRTRVQSVKPEVFQAVTLDSVRQVTLLVVQGVGVPGLEADPALERTACRI